jgi:2-oxoglutarate ferredoxin oxidoreductase subunit alpha
LPTWTEQGDLLFVVHAGHGEFPKIVLTPGDVQEMIELTAKAFNLADIYQLPVIVISDMYLSESHQSLSRQKLNDFIASYQIKRGKTVSQPSETKYLRYGITDDGVSERLIPGAKNYFYQANSYEHLEDSHTTEDGNERKKQVEKRDRKWKTYLQNDFALPNTYGDLDTARNIMVSWGSTKGVLLEAQKLLKNTAIIHFNHVYPLDRNKIAPLLNKQGKRYILVENNFYGQFGKLLLAETGIEIKEKLLKYDGRQFKVKEITDKVSI